MRLGELAHLRWKDVDFRHNLIHIQNQPDWTTKSRKPRVVPMHPVVKQILAETEATSFGAHAGGKGPRRESLSKNKPEDYIFATRSGKTIESYLRAEILRYAKKAKISANVKMFRSTFASNLVMSGVDIYVVSKILGRHDVKITEKHYAHLTPNYLNQSVNRLSFSASLGDRKQKTMTDQN